MTMLVQCCALAIYFLLKASISRVPDQNGVSQACYIVEIFHSGSEPLKCSVLIAKLVVFCENILLVVFLFLCLFALSLR